jgi:hypothetical protein
MTKDLHAENSEAPPVQVRFRQKCLDHDVGDITSFPPAKATILVRTGVVRFVDRRRAFRSGLRSLQQWITHPFRSFSDWHLPKVYADFEDGHYELVVCASKRAANVDRLVHWLGSHSSAVLCNVIVAVITAIILALIGFGQ